MTTDRYDQEGASSTGIVAAWARFWFTPTDPTLLHRVRTLCGLAFFFWLLLFAGNHQALFGLNGWLDREAYVEARLLPGGPPAPIGRFSLVYLAGENAGLFDAIYWGSLAVIALFTLGIAPRITGVLTWIVVLSFIANPATSFDADFLLVILAFYLMLAYLFVGQWNSPLTPVERVLGPFDAAVWAMWAKRDGPAAPPSHAAAITLRLLQVHFALIMVASGLHKLQMADWWSGIAFWYPMNPPLQATAESLRRQASYGETLLVMMSLTQYLALAWQLTFPFFAWRKGWWRLVLVGGGVLGWLGSYFLLRQPLFGPVTFIGCLTYLTAAEWAWVRSRVFPGAAPAVRVDRRVPVGAGRHGK